MPDKPSQTPDPSEAEARLAVEATFRGLPERLSAEDLLRLMQDRIAELKQRIEGWLRILDTDAANEAAQKCLASDRACLRDAESRLQAQGRIVELSTASPNAVSNASPIPR